MIVTDLPCHACLSTINHNLGFWQGNYISHVGRTILINSTIMSTPIKLYYINLTHRKYIKKNSIKFLANSFGRTFMLTKVLTFLIGTWWSLPKILALSIKDFTLFHIATQCKHILDLLNHKHTICTDLVKVKYDIHNHGNIS